MLGVRGLHCSTKGQQRRADCQCVPGWHPSAAAASIRQGWLPSPKALVSPAWLAPCRCPCAPAAAETAAGVAAAAKEAVAPTTVPATAPPTAPSAPAPTVVTPVPAVPIAPVTPAVPPAAPLPVAPTSSPPAMAASHYQPPQYAAPTATTTTTGPATAHTPSGTGQWLCMQPWFAKEGSHRHAFRSQLLSHRQACSALPASAPKLSPRCTAHAGGGVFGSGASPQAAAASIHHAAHKVAGAAGPELPGAATSSPAGIHAGKKGLTPAGCDPRVPAVERARAEAPR